MSAAVLREAAALMRERAVFCAAGTGARWHLVENGQTMIEDETGGEVVHYDGVRNLSDAEHIASWHPGVALAVADWLDAEAEEIPPNATHYRGSLLADAPAVRVARAYLGTP